MRDPIGNNFSRPRFPINLHQGLYLYVLDKPRVDYILARDTLRRGAQLEAIGPIGLRPALLVVSLLEVSEKKGGCSGPTPTHWTVKNSLWVGAGTDIPRCLEEKEVDWKQQVTLSRRKEGNVLFNDALITFYLRLCGVGHMVKAYLDSERGNCDVITWLLFSISSTIT